MNLLYLFQTKTQKYTYYMKDRESVNSLQIIHLTEVSDMPLPFPIIAFCKILCNFLHSCHVLINITFIKT